MEAAFAPSEVEYHTLSIFNYLFQNGDKNPLCFDTEYYYSFIFCGKYPHGPRAHL